MNNSDTHFVIAIGSGASEYSDDERALEGKYLFDRDEEVQESAEPDEDEIGDEDSLTHKGGRGSARQNAVWESLTDDDPE